MSFSEFVLVSSSHPPTFARARVCVCVVASSSGSNPWVSIYPEAYPSCTMTVSRLVGRPAMAMESRMAGPCSSHSSRQVPPTQRQRQALPRGGRKFFLSKREGCPSKFRIHSQRQDGEDWDSNSHESSEDGFMEIEEEFRRIVQRNFDGLELQSREAEMDLSEMELSSEDDVTFWLEVDKPEEPKVEAQELFDWWNDLDQVYVLIFQLNDGEEDGIFTLKDSSEEENNNFILSFESQVEAARYGSKLQANLQGMEAEIELMGRDELLQLCKELEVGVRIIKEVCLSRNQSIFAKTKKRTNE